MSPCTLHPTGIMRLEGQGEARAAATTRKRDLDGKVHSPLTWGSFASSRLHFMVMGTFSRTVCLSTQLSLSLTHFKVHSILVSFQTCPTTHPWAWGHQGHGLHSHTGAPASLAPTPAKGRVRGESPWVPESHSSRVGHAESRSPHRAAHVPES